MLAACGDNTAPDETAAPIDETIEHEHNDGEDHSSETDRVELNDGKQWEANPETTTGVEKMKDLINEFNVNSDQPAYSALHDRLDEEFKTIFAKCTMTGEAHNQLHNYLHPMRGYIDGLVVADEETRHRSLEMLNARLDEYPSYFVTAT